MAYPYILPVSGIEFAVSVAGIASVLVAAGIVVHFVGIAAAQVADNIEVVLFAVDKGCAALIALVIAAGIVDIVAV